MFCILYHLLRVWAGNLGKGIVAEIADTGRDCVTHFVMQFICMKS